MIIKDMPEEAKPREKALKFGIQSLSTDELIAIILRCGCKGKSATDLAQEILKEFNIYGKDSLPNIKSLYKVKGIGKTKALTLLTALELGKRCSREILVTSNQKITNSRILYKYIAYHYTNIYQEQLIVILLNTKKEVIDSKIVFQGALDNVVIHPREIYKYAISNSAASIIIAHNHPSNDITPSKADILVTKNIKKCGEIFGIPLIDHMIFGDNNYYSFYENGDLSEEK